jgi:hypothetical protein
MARAKASPLSVKKHRLELPVARKPVFESLGDGVSVGYRRNQSAGTWLVRKSDGKGGSSQRVVGIADDYADADGAHVLTWAQAQAKAFEIARAGKISSAKIAMTVAAALDRYEADLKTRGGDSGNVQRLRVHISRHLLEKSVAELTNAGLRKWRDDLANELAPATVNRTANAFKAALNLAAEHDEAILTRGAWEKGLSSLPDAEEARNIVLTDVEVKKLVDAAYKQSVELGQLVEVSAITGARYSQIASLLVGDLQDDRDEPRLMMPSAKKGKGIKKVLRRPVPISVALAKKLRRAAGKRSDPAPLLLKPTRPLTDAEKRKNVPPRQPDKWRKSDHSRPFARVVASAFKVESNPDNTSSATVETREPITIYALRHSSIVRQILRGVPIRVVAVLHDTSVEMIEKNYSKYLADHSDTVVRAALIDIAADST